MCVYIKALFTVLTFSKKNVLKFSYHVHKNSPLNYWLPFFVIISQWSGQAQMYCLKHNGDYRYTQLSYKINSLISRTCCLGSYGLTYTQADAGVMPFICDAYRNITTKILSIDFNYLFLLLLISLETTTPHVRRCPLKFNKPIGADKG